MIHDFIGMLGQIGGTLGMFIGSSFLGVISSTMEYLQNLADYLSFKKNQKMSKGLTKQAQTVKDNGEIN